MISWIPDYWKDCGCGECNNKIEWEKVEDEHRASFMIGRPRLLISNKCPKGVPRNCVVLFVGDDYKVYEKIKPVEQPTSKLFVVIPMFALVVIITLTIFWSLINSN